MRLVQHIIDSMAAKVLSPYTLEYMSAHEQTLFPATKISEIASSQPSESSTIIGWLVDTLSEPSLEMLSQTSRHLTNLSDQVTIRVIEAPPGDCTHLADMNQWLSKHRDAHRLFCGSEPFQKDSVRNAKLLVYAVTEITSASNHVCIDEAAWILMQSLAEGVPILTSPGLAGVLDHSSEARAMVGTSYDPLELANAIRAFVTQQRVQQSMNQAATALAKAQFSCECAAEAHLEV